MGDAAAIEVTTCNVRQKSDSNYCCSVSAEPLEHGAKGKKSPPQYFSQKICKVFFSKRPWISEYESEVEPPVVFVKVHICILRRTQFFFSKSPP